MPAWKLVTVAYKLRRGWSRIPPAQRKKLVENASRQAKKRGPVAARRLGTAIRQVRKGR